MKNKTMLVLMALMVVTLVAMVVLQYTMIYHLNRLSVERFDQSAEQAVRRTIRFLEDKETLNYVAVAVAEIDSTYGAELDSLRNSASFVSRENREASGHGDKSVDRTIEIIHEQAIKDSVRVHEIVNRAMNQWVNDSKNIELRRRLDFTEIYEVLGSHLELLGIDAPYEFFIYDQDSMLVYCSPLVQSNDRLRYPKFVYRLPLFPTEFGGHKGSIKVVFPTMKTELLNTWQRILPSVIVVFLVMIIFIYTTVTINRQRTWGQMKSDFINNMTHEFKTPLASISLASQMLQDPNVSDSRKASLANIISKESKRLQLLIEKVLQISVYEKDSSKIQLTDLSVNQEIDNVCNSFEIHISHVGGQLNKELDAQNDIALIDPIHFSNIIYNLLDNAVKYRSEDRPLLIFVRTSCTQEGKLQITVEDNGIGISRSDLRHVFEQFFRVHTGDRHDVKGYGIGLAYVKRMVDAHHGTINVTSIPNVGTRFTIMLPTLN